MSKVIAVGNNKGGVAKTTTAVNLAKGLADAGMRVLLIDADPQGNATSGFGIDIENLDHTIGDFNDYIELCNACMHNLKVTMNNLDE